MLDCVSLRKCVCRLWLFPLGLSLFSWSGAYAVEPLPTTSNGASATMKEFAPVAPPVVSSESSAVSAPLAAPEAVDASKVVAVKGFRFSGNTLIKEPELSALLQPYLNQFCDLGKLREAANVVTQEYLRRGHLFAKAYILQQNIVDGMVVISVVEGRIGKVTVEGSRYYSTDFIHSYLTSGDAPLNLERFDWGLLLLNSKFADLSVTANFVPGVEPGTTDINVKAVDKFPLRFSVSRNNYGSEFVSRNRTSGQFVLTNLAVAGSQTTVGGMVGDQISKMHIVNVGTVVPLNSVGTMGSISVLSGTSEVGKEFADLGIRNNENSFDLSVSQPLVVSRTGTLFAKGGFRVANTKYFYLLDQLSGYDKIRAVYAELQGDMVSNGGKTFANVGFSQGLGSILSGTKSGDYLASRQDANNSFTKITGSVARLQPLSDAWSSVVRLSGQWTPAPVLAGEEWLIGGVNSVHGYAAGEAAGSEGLATSLSLRLTPLENRELLQMSLFLEYAYAHKKKPLVGSRPTTELTGIGTSFASHIGDISTPIDLRFDMGWPLNPTTNGILENPMLSFDVSVVFF